MSSWNKLLLFVIAFAAAFSLHAQPYQMWVAKYNSGITRGTNRPVAMAIDSSGNVVVTGYAQNASSNLDYVTLKYSPSGTQLWAARYDSTNADDVPRALAIDRHQNVIVTGTTTTIKYDSNGQQQWTAPYGGKGVAADTNDNIYVTGFLPNVFSTVKLSAAGSNLWLNTYYFNLNWMDNSQTIAIAPDSTICVAGQMVPYSPGSYYYTTGIGLVKYDVNGNQLYATSVGSGANNSAHAAGIVFDHATNAYVAFDGYSYSNFMVAKMSSPVWETNALPNLANNLSTKATAAVRSGIYVVGGTMYESSAVFGIGKVDYNGNALWQRFYYGRYSPSDTYANALTTDNADNAYVTGYELRSNPLQYDIVTFKYDKDGNQQWGLTYDSPVHRDDQGVAIALDQIGNIYVAGYETDSAYGTQIVLVKYSDIKLQRRVDGTVHVGFPAFAGQTYAFQATTNFVDWLNLGNSIADTNNVASFDDTNAAVYPWRIYRAIGL